MADDGRPAAPSSSPRYEDVTETTGIPVTAESASMIYTRYALSAERAAGRRVLEVGCGAGQGFGLVAARARALVGGDYSMALLRGARIHYGRRVPLVRLSAEHLPFRTGAFDLVLLFEASYYVPRMELAFDELARLLASGGMVLFANANPERPDFIRSPYSVHYHTADELRSALEQRGLRATTEAAFRLGPATTGHGATLADAALTAARRMARALRLVPRTLRGRSWLKRLVYGRSLRSLPPELPVGFAPVEPRAVVGDGPVQHYKVIYVSGTRGPA
jgi:SAM-dependent methyltransferase